MPRDVMRSCDSDLMRLKHDDILVEVKSFLAISIHNRQSSSGMAKSDV